VVPKNHTSSNLRHHVIDHFVDEKVQQSNHLLIVGGQHYTGPVRNQRTVVRNAIIGGEKKMRIH
jgi:hypothetical protein